MHACRKFGALLQGAETGQQCNVEEVVETSMAERIETYVGPSLSDR
jgi:hypothetical protein